MINLLEWIKQWAEGIIIAVIIATILEMLLPDNKNKKYITTVIGIYILFSIISPIISKFTGKNINIEDYIKKSTEVSTNYSINNVALLENSSNVEEIYSKTLKADITEKLKSKNYNADYIELKIDTDSQKNYGEIQGIYLQISPLEKENSISYIEPVDINVSNEKISKSDQLSEEEINVVKDFLMDTYGIDKNKIHINREE